jgi:hypothetical protein
MGTMMPERKTTPSIGIFSLKTLLVAIVYIVLIPAVSFVSLWAGITYFPKATKALISPLFEEVVEEPSAFSHDLEVLNARVTNLSAKIEETETTLKDISLRVSQTEEGGTQPESSSILESQKQVSDKMHMLLGLSALTAARAEYLAGNREVASSEVHNAKKALNNVSSIDQDLLSMLDNALNEIGKDSASSKDWLNLSWHTLMNLIDTDLGQ